MTKEEQLQRYPILSQVTVPADFRQLELHDLKQLCVDIRSYLIDVISEVGGHFGGGLGTVELSVALHKVFQTPYDQIIWDTGHQAYPHKILTGRKDRLHTIRQLHGLSGFLKRSESEYDTFGAGHASTSVSAAVGVAEAQRYIHEQRKVVAVIGDGAMTGGMAYEAMNNAGFLKTNMVLVLNDNN
ncbi:partial 1-deoxy-D-xylulose-5-phosphate synthase, partial [Candidatus Brocadiaceae bacterium]